MEGYIKEKFFWALVFAMAIPLLFLLYLPDYNNKEIRNLREIESLYQNTIQNKLQDTIPVMEMYMNNNIMYVDLNNKQIYFEYSDDIHNFNTYEGLFITVSNISAYNVNYPIDEYLENFNH